MTSEASSLAGHQQLGNLVVIYDSNQISIEDDTNIAFTEDVAEALRGLRLARADRRLEEDRRVRRGRRRAARAPSRRPRPRLDKPSIIILKTIIGWPSPGKQNTGKIHGSALGADELAAVKEVLGFDPEKTFDVADDVLAHTREARRARRRAARRVAGRVRRLGRGQPRAQGAARPARGRRAPGGRRGRAARLRGRQRGLHPRRVRQGPQRARRGRSPSSGAVRPTSPSRTTRRSRAPPRSSRPSARPTSGRATRTAACCTSASASTPWPRSSTASCCTARPAPSAARS